MVGFRGSVRGGDHRSLSDRHQSLMAVAGRRRILWRIGSDWLGLWLERARLSLVASFANGIIKDLTAITAISALFSDGA